MPLAKPTRRRPSVPARTAHNDLFVSRTAPSRWMVPKHKGVTKVPLAVSVAAFLTVIAVSVGTLAASSMERDDQMLRASLAEAQQGLLARLDRLEKLCSPVAVIPSGTTTSALPVTVTAKDLADLHSVIDANTWNTEAPTETIEYRDKDRKVSIRLPYNPKWGNSMYKVAPFEVSGENTQYGPIIMANGFRRSFTMMITPSRDVTAIRKAYPTSTEAPVKITSVGTADFEVYRIEQGTQKSGSLEFVGRRYNYIFSKQSTDPQNSFMTAPSTSEALPIIRSLKSI